MTKMTMTWRIGYLSKCILLFCLLWQLALAVTDAVSDVVVVIVVSCAVLVLIIISGNEELLLRLLELRLLLVHVTAVL